MDEKRGKNLGRMDFVWSIYAIGKCYMNGSLLVRRGVGIGKGM